jgi:hypothetical protein
MDSRSYQEDLTTAAKRIKIPQGSQLIIVAAGWPAEIVNGTPIWRTGQIAPGDVRTHLRGTIEVVGTAAANSVDSGRLIINGVLIEGALKVQAGSLGALELAHSTLAPGLSTLTCADNPGLSIELTRTICGDLTPGASARTVRLTECIVDGDVSARDVHVDASTIFGTTKAQTLHASNSILLGKVTVERRQEGCVRFSYLPFDSESPRRYRCQPEDGAEAARVRPRFESVSFGEPAYAQLTGSTPPEIVTGAEDEGEMGAWHFVQAPLRLRNLRVALDEYLRFGLEAGVFIVRQQPKEAAAVSREIREPHAAFSARRKRAKTPARATRTTRARTRPNTANAPKPSVRTSRRSK